MSEFAILMWSTALAAFFGSLAATLLSLLIYYFQNKEQKKESINKTLEKLIDLNNELNRDINVYHHMIKNFYVEKNSGKDNFRNSYADFDKLSDKISRTSTQIQIQENILIIKNKEDFLVKRFTIESIGEFISAYGIIEESIGEEIFRLISFYPKGYEKMKDKITLEGIKRVNNYLKLMK